MRVVRAMVCYRTSSRNERYAGNLSALFTFYREDFEEIGVTAKCAPPLRSRSQKKNYGLVFNQRR